MPAGAEATSARPVHVFVRTKETPGACGRCRLIKANGVHCEEGDPRLLAQDQAQAEHRRRAGDNR